MKSDKKSRGLRNNNPFNIVQSKNYWLGKKSKSSDPVFEQFDTLELGIRAGLIVLRTYINKYKLHDVDSIIRRFAPECDNDVDSYVSFVKSRFDVLSYSLNNIDYHSRQTLCLAQSIMLFESNYFMPLMEIQDIIDTYHL